MKFAKLLVGLVVAMVLLASAAWAAESVLLDSIDFGSAGDDAGRTLSGWGRSATDETGGGYGSVGLGGCRIVWDSGLGGDGSRDAKVLLEPGKGAVKSLVIRHLDGLADDSFAIYVQRPNGSWLHVGSYADQYSSENWLETTFDLSGYGFGRGRKEIGLKLESTGEAWSGFETWGQLCIDWLEVYGSGKP